MPTPSLNPEHKSWLRCYLDTGIPGHLAMLVFLVTLAFAVVIFRKRLGLRYRLALVPLAMMPLVSGIMGCGHDYSLTGGPVDLWSRAINEVPLQAVAMTSVQTGILLMTCIALLLHKDAGRPWEREGL